MLEANKISKADFLSDSTCFSPFLLSNFPDDLLPCIKVRQAEAPVLCELITRGLDYPVHELQNRVCPMNPQLITTNISVT
jgi:hypothetical protein